MADFGKLNFAVSFNPQTAFPLDARYYFSSLSAAEAAAATGSSDGTYFYGENVCVVTESSADLYIIQPDKTLKAVGSAVLGDGKSIEIVDGKVALKGFGSATAGQQPRINAAGTTHPIPAPFPVWLIPSLVIHRTFKTSRLVKLIRLPRLKVMVSLML